MENILDFLVSYEDDFTDLELACYLLDGEIDCPEWLDVSEHNGVITLKNKENKKEKYSLKL